VRLQKYLADAGVASRRASEQIILAGRVKINGTIVKELGSQVQSGLDRVTVDDRPITSRKKLYVALNKPKGVICARSEQQSNRRLVLDLLPREWDYLYPVGRLDKDSEGLIFLTNDGDFCLRLTHPRYGIRKKYLATVEGMVTQEITKAISEGIRDKGEFLKAEKVRVIKRNNSHSLVEVEMSEGRNLEVRRLFASQNLEVSRLQRIQIGPIKIGELPEGKWRTLTEIEINSLLGRL
jgi:23S rRNA pseudouridine2605 synthase